VSSIASWKQWARRTKPRNLSSARSDLPDVVPFVDPPAAINRLIVAVVGSDDAGALVDKLISAGVGVTRLESAGGFLRRGNASLLIGIPASRLDDVLESIASLCKTQAVPSDEIFLAYAPEVLPFASVAVRVGGATVFVCEVDRVVFLGE
jgi:uncharacterized protein YaaQ